MLDEKGRLFGKINIVDLLIVVVIIAAVAFVGIKYVLPHADEAPKDEVEIHVFVDNTYRFVTDQLAAGTSVYDSTDKVEMGTLESWEVHPYYEAVLGTGDVNPVMTEIPDKCTVEVVLKVKGNYGEHGTTVEGYLLGLGHTMVFYAGDCKLFGAVKSMTVIK